MKSHGARPRCGYYFVSPLWGLFFNLAVGVSGHGMPCPYIASLVVGLKLELSSFWVVILVDLDVLDALLYRLDRYWGWGMYELSSFWVVILVDLDVLDALLSRLDRYWGWVEARVEFFLSSYSSRFRCSRCFAI